MCGSDATRKTYQVNCAKCATPTESKRKSGKVFCLPCRNLAKNKYQEIYKDKDPEKHRAMRRNRTKQKALVGDKVPCAECGVVIKKKSSRHIRCDACVEAKTLKDREIRKQNRKKVIGTKIKCSDCGKEIIKDSPARIRCGSCQEINSRAVNQAYKINNIERIRKARREWAAAKRNNCEIYSLTCRIRRLLSDSIRNGGYTKRSRTHEILGCSWEEFKIHIERQFTKGMSWDNRGEWHLDHIVPISSATTEEECLRLNHFTNIRPLWALDNMRKGANMEFLI